MRTAIAILAVSVFSGCSSFVLSEEEKAARDAQEAVRQESFNRFVEQCKTAGGRVTIAGTGRSSNVNPADGSMDVPPVGTHYECVIAPR
jgi:hypothetical protein